MLELSWYGDAEVRLSLGGAFHSGRLTIRASQVGAVAPARRGRADARDRLALALDLLRDPAFDALLTGVVAVRRAARGDGPAGRRRAAGPVPHDHLRRGVSAMFSVTVRDHMMIAHSFRGEVFGPAQRLHGATFVVDATFRGAALDADGIVVDIGRATEELHAVARRAELPQPRRRARRSPGMNTTTEALAQVDRRPARRRGSAPARSATAAGGSDGIAVTLHESHVAWASYERRCDRRPRRRPGRHRRPGASQRRQHLRPPGLRRAAALGWTVHEHAVPGAWPRPDAAARAALARSLAGDPRRRARAASTG